MLAYNRMVIRQRKWMLYLIAVFVLGAGFSPYERFFFGLILGSVISFYNLFLLQKKTNQFAEAVVNNQRVRGIGFISRLASVALAVIIALRFEQHFDMIAVIIGLMTSYVVIIIDFIIFHNKDSA